MVAHQESKARFRPYSPIRCGHASDTVQSTRAVQSIRVLGDGTAEAKFELEPLTRPTQRQPKSGRRAAAEAGGGSAGNQPTVTHKHAALDDKLSELGKRPRSNHSK